VLKLELLQKLVKITLGSADFLLKQFGTFLQVATDVTH
jgi:hypothetical protein